MSKELKFFIYLLERYAEQKGTDAQKIIAEWDELGVTDYIYEMYETSAGYCPWSSTA